MIDHDTTYICLECGFHGTADEFSRHETYPEHYYHGEFIGAEVELQCPECGQTEDEGIAEACFCEFCQTWQPEESVHKHPEDDSVMICTKCSVARQIMKGDTK